MSLTREVAQLEQDYNLRSSDIMDGTMTKGVAQLYQDTGAAPEAIVEAGGGVIPTGSISITTNTTTDVTNYAEAVTNIPASAVVSGTKSITANGTDIDVTNYAKVDVAVPAVETKIGTVTIVNNATEKITVASFTNDPYMAGSNIKLGYKYINILPGNSSLVGVLLDYLDQENKWKVNSFNKIII